MCLPIYSSLRKWSQQKSSIINCEDELDYKFTFAFLMDKYYMNKFIIAS